ncbi:RNA polymerase sigma factor [Nonomuraea sp. CA-218870]|uniref:RNA polymerase sigma factor n=1 Tax=Nonomuraea sp. CA-218870 TaxID=3239998 RepID=UPI003D89CA7F
MPRKRPEFATDPVAFEAFYRRHVEAVTRFFARRVDDPHTVADLVAEVFVAVLDSAHTYRSDLGTELGWLYGVARNTLSAERRRVFRQSRLADRVGGRRRTRGRRLLTGAAAAGLAAAAAFVVPTLAGVASPAHAVSEDADGTIVVTIAELRDADQLERDLAALGVRADVTYAPAGKRCDGPRGDIVADRTAGRTALREPWTSYPKGGKLTIDPARIGADQTLVMEFSERDPAEPAGDGMTVWRYGGWIVRGEVRPCALVDDEFWNKPIG